MLDKEVNIRKIYENLDKMYRVMIELTTKCNYDCIHCYLDRKHNDMLSKEELFELLEQLRRLGVYEIEFTGGEIFTRKDIFEILAYARKLKFKVILVTNISLLNKEQIKFLENLGIEEITTTLFSINDSINDLITNGKGSASKIIENLEELIKTNIKIEVKTVIMKYNINEIREIEEFCNKRGIYYTPTEGLFPSNNGEKIPRSLTVNSNELRKILEYIDKIRFGTIYNEFKDNKKVCCDSKFSLFIDAKGDVFPCNLWNKKVGNVLETKIEDIWLDKMLVIIRNLKWEDMKICNSCELNKYCIKCPGIIYNSTGNIESCDKFARRTASIRKKIISKNM